MERKLIAAAVSSALALPLAAQAVEFSVSGHVNRAVISVDGGVNDSDVRHVDSNASETRFRFTGSEELDSGMTAGVQLELGRPGNWRTRHANVYLSTAGGKLTLGQGSAAMDGVAHADLGGPSLLGGATNWCSYHSKNGADADAVACPSNDGDRLQVLRYDTPAIGPASIAVSTGNNDYWDAKLTIAGSMGDAGYAIRVGHAGENDEDISEVTTASIGVGFGQGTTVAAAWSQDEANDHEYQYMKVDHSYGDGSVAVYYKRGEDADSEGSLWGIGLGHSLGGGATAYAGYRMIEEDGEDDVTLLVAGMRVTFN